MALYTTRDTLQSYPVSPTATAYTWTRRDRRSGRLFAYSLLVTDRAVLFSGFVWRDDDQCWSLVTRTPHAKVDLDAPIPSALAARWAGVRLGPVF